MGKNIFYDLIGADKAGVKCRPNIDMTIRGINYKNAHSLAPADSIKFLDCTWEGELPSYMKVEGTKEDSGSFLTRVGVNGMLWAEEMHERFPAVSTNDLLGWCCNMIEAGKNHEHNKMRKNLDAPQLRALIQETIDNPTDYITDNLLSQIKGFLNI